MNKKMINRIIIYVAGLLVLALGIILNTKSGLGVSPIISVSYSISHINEFNFANTTLAMYAIFVLIEIILHVIMNLRNRKNQTKNAALVHANKNSMKYIILVDLLQFPLSILFTRFMNLFSVLLPDFSPEGTNTVSHFIVQLIVLFAALVLTGVGAAMSLNMRIIPNPGDGIVQTLADFCGKGVGITKNCFDVFNVVFTCCIGLIFTGHLVGIGIGTICSMIGVGRVIAVFNHFFREKMIKAAGVEI